jgi:hypothetical protein
MQVRAGCGCRVRTTTSLLSSTQYHPPFVSKENPNTHSWTQASIRTYSDYLRWARKRKSSRKVNKAPGTPARLHNTTEFFQTPPYKSTELTVLWHHNAQTRLVGHEYCVHLMLVLHPWSVGRLTRSILKRWFDTKVVTRHDTYEAALAHMARCISPSAWVQATCIEGSTPLCRTPPAAARTGKYPPNLTACPT